MEKVAIVILNWNGAEMLKRFLPNVLEYSRKDATVYVADNASTDDSLEILKQRFPEVRLVLLEKNWGFAEGYNKALEQIEAEYYVLLNSDVEVAHHWLAPLVEFMETILRLQPVSQNCCLRKIMILLNMQEPVADILTVMAILFVAAEFLILLRLTTDNMITMLKCCGLREHV